MAVLYTNNAASTLSSSITSTTTSLSVASGQGALFPSPTGSDYFYLTLANSAGAVEIVKVTARTTDTLTIVRGQDGTTGLAWAAGDRVELRVVRAMLDALKTDAASGYLPLSGGTLTGNLAFNGSGLKITGDFSGAANARLTFQTSTANGQTLVTAIPNGTGVNSQFQAYNSSDPLNSSIASLVASASQVRIVSGYIGTGTINPITFIFANTEAARFTPTTYNLLIGTTSDNGTDKLQVNGSVSATSYSGSGAALTGFTSSQITTALGFTPYNSTNPNGYITSSSLSSYLPLSGGTLTGATNISTASQTINTTTPGTGAYQLNFTGQATADYAHAITWGWSTSGAQAGVYVQSSGAYGTKMYLATTDSFATGAKTAVSIDHSGNVNIARGALTQGGNQVLHAGNYNTYSPTLTGSGASGTWSISVTGNAATVSSITSSQVTTALGYTPYNSSNPSGYITSSSLSSYLPLTGGTLTGNLIFGNSTSPNTNYIQFGDNTGWKLRFMTSVSGTPTERFSFTDGGAFNAVGAITQNGNQVLHAGNYNTYSPTLTGGGASGTWSIAVSGNAGTASQAYQSTDPASSTYRILLGNGTNANATVYNYSALYWNNATSTIQGANISGNAATANSATSAGSATTATTASYLNAAQSSADVGAISSRINSGFYQNSAPTTAGGWPVTGSWYHLLSSTHSNTANYYAMQLAADFFSNTLYYRSTNGSGTTSWVTVLHSGNYNSYSPTLTGGGASGSWGINITGSAASITGTYGGTLTSSQVTTALGFTPYNSTNPNGYITGITSSMVTTALGYTPVRKSGESFDTVNLNTLGASDGGFYTAANTGGNSPTGSNDAVIHVPYANSLWAHQIGMNWNTGNSQNLYFRTLNNGTWQSWLTVLHSGNYNSYSPTLTGGGASGSWGISVTGSSASCTGNAATATTATTATTANALNTANNYQVNSLGVGTAASGVAGEIRATNNVTAYYSSDARLKENIRPIEKALDKVSAIGGKLFDWTDEYIEEHGGEDGYFIRKADFGVVAQDVERVFPIAVRRRPNGSLAVDYEKLCALAFAAINELRAKIEALKAA